MTSLNPKVDLAFKKIFGVEENKDLLISLINSIVSKEDQVTDITLLNPYNLKNFNDDKLSILDIKASGEDGKRFNIEVQISDEADYDKRALYYWAKLYTEQLKQTEDYSSLCKTIGIHILNFNSIPNSTQYHNIFNLTEQSTNIEYFKDIELHTIELRKFTSNPHEKLPDILAKVKTSLDMWTTFLTRHELLNKDDLPEKLNDANLKKALDVIETLNLNKDEREAYENHLKHLRMEVSAIKKASMDAREDEKINIAKKLLSKGMNVEDVANITELTLDQVVEIGSM